MNRIKFLLFNICITIGCMANVTENINGLVFSIDTINCTAIITGCQCEESIISIPHDVEFNNKCYPILSIGDNCFSRCENIKSIYVPSSVVSIGNYAFENCISLESITLPDSLHTIGNVCFYGCKSLKEIIIPNKVEYIGFGCFQYCESLTSVEIPSSIKELKETLFVNCTSLYEIKLSNSLTKIGYGCFSGCSSLMTIDIPKPITELPAYCFSGCMSLKEIKCNSIIPPSINTNTFNGVNIIDITLIVPEAGIDNYITSAYWQDFGTISTNVETDINFIRQDVSITVSNKRVTVSGLQDGEIISVYNLDGVKLGSVISYNKLAFYDLKTTGVILIKARNYIVKIIV